MKVLDNEYIEKSKNVSGYFLTFMIMYGVTFIPNFLWVSDYLLNKGVLYPILFIVEFSIIIPIYFKFFKGRNMFGFGNFNFLFFFTSLVCIMFIQYFSSVIFNNSSDAWVMEQEQLNGISFWLTMITVIFIVPMYEEIIFRGCLFDVCAYWFFDSRLIGGGISSFVFCMMHSQYDLLMKMVLFFVSVILIIARLRTKGLFMPIVLHMSMNALILFF